MVSPSRRQTQFYIPSPAAGTEAALSRTQSRTQPDHLPGSSLHSRRESMAFSSSLSVPTTPSMNRFSLSSHRRSSRSSLTALRAALETYHVPVEADTPPLPHFETYSTTSSPYLEGDAGSSSASRLRSPAGLKGDMMDALVDIHRVLYRGKEDLRVDGKILSWEEQGKEVKRVVDRWFEGDCVYDHPVMTITSRQSLLHHYILLHLISTMYLPSLTPSAILEHAKSVTSRLRARLLGETEEGDEETAPRLRYDYKGKGKALEAGLRMESDEWLLGDRRPSEPEALRNKNWWRLWDVSADCREIGGMECYDGYHIALIDHVITLTLLPSLAKPRSSLSSPSSFSSLDLHTARTPAPSFLARLAESLAQEFDYLLHWELPVSTMVEFNEVGKATRVRDVVDVRDAIETFVPLAKRVGWISRRLAGVVTSTLGSIAMAFVPGPSVRVTAPVRIEMEWEGTTSEVQHTNKRNPGLGFEGLIPPPRRFVAEPLVSDEIESNSLGLEGVGSMAPDIDGGEVLTEA